MIFIDMMQILVGTQDLMHPSIAFFVPITVKVQDMKINSHFIFIKHSELALRKIFAGMIIAERAVV